MRENQTKTYFSPSYTINLIINDNGKEADMI